MFADMHRLSHDGAHAVMENEVVIMRSRGYGNVGSALRRLSERNKPWPTALVLAYVPPYEHGNWSQPGRRPASSHPPPSGINGSAIAAQLSGTGMLDNFQSTFADDTLVVQAPVGIATFNAI